MYAISLTSIPPRFDRLRPVLESLLAQEPAPSQILLCLPRRYHRFPGPITAPDVPEGVSVIWSDRDLGPATKVLPAARALAKTSNHLIYCDDDWLMPPGWAGTCCHRNDPERPLQPRGTTYLGWGGYLRAPPEWSILRRGFPGC